MRCKHGTNVGTPGGADLMCQWCEDGTEPPHIRVQILRQDADGTWEPIFPPKMCYDYAEVDWLVEGLIGLDRYAAAIG